MGDRRGHISRQLPIGAAIALTIAGCRSGGPPLPTRAVAEGVGGPTVAVAAPTLVARSTPATVGSARVDAGPAASPAAITHTAELVTFERGLRPLPGPWSPDGKRLLAFAASVPTAVAGSPAVTPPADETPAVAAVADPSVMVRLWTVDAERAAPLWDSGDVEDRLDMADGVAAWLDDGSLALARGQDSLVTADGKPIRSIGPERQPRQVYAAPSGRSALEVGPSGAWIVTEGAAASAIQKAPTGGFDAWSWRSDGGMLAMSGADGGLYVVDPMMPIADKIGEATGARVAGRYAAPRWLADGTVLMADAIPARQGDRTAVDFRVLKPDEGGTSLAGRFGLPTSRWTPRVASDWVSGDGRYVFYPQVSAPSGGVSAVRWWLLEVTTGVRREAPAMTEPHWAPSGARLAYRAGDGLAVWRPDNDTSRLLRLDNGRKVVAFAWSPSGRWLALTDDAGGLWLAACDVEAGPTAIADDIDTGHPPTFAADDSHMAVAVHDEEGATRLALVTFGIERP